MEGKKKRTALIVAIAVIVLAVGAIVVFVAVQGQKGPGSGDAAASAKVSASSAAQSGAGSSASASASSGGAASEPLFGGFADNRPESDDHGRFLSFSVEPDGSDAGVGRRYAILKAEWVPGKYDLGGNAVKLEGNPVKIVARVLIDERGGVATFEPAESMSDNVNWNVSGVFGNGTITLVEGSWTVDFDDETSATVSVDNLTLNYTSTSA